MSLPEAIILALIEGLTEFLPVSSTGHIIIGSTLMGISHQPFTKMYTVVVQFGAIAAVVVLYWQRFVKSFNFYVILFIAFVPAAVAGLLLETFIDRWLERVDVVAYALIAGGIFFLVADKFFETNEKNPAKDVTRNMAWRIGLFQCLALIPGISRSAATIIGGLSQKLDRKTATEFSFFLAVPTLAAASGYKLLKFFIFEGYPVQSHEVTLLFTGNMVAFLVAMLAMKSFIAFLSRYGFKLFGYYRIFAGALLLGLYYFGTDLVVL
ncbi:MAG: undecaprenyl-diphosphatase [Cyclobacteriaceae bacterium]|nr:MAG: undecaprenyl-diphosphatase [Cyclobacteriaceae bacterium]